MNDLYIKTKTYIEGHEKFEFYKLISKKYCIFSNSNDFLDIIKKIGLSKSYNKIPSMEVFWDFLVPKENIYFNGYNLICLNSNDSPKPIGMFGFIQTKEPNIKYNLFEQLYNKFIKNKNPYYSEMNTTGFFIVLYDVDLKIKFL